MALRRYVPSGHGGPLAIAAVLGAALVAGVIAGVIEGVVNQWFSLFLVFPLLIGVAAGAAAVGMIGRHKLRAPMIALVLGIIGGGAGYLATHTVEYVRFRSVLAEAIQHDRPDATEAELAAEIDGALVHETGSPGIAGYLGLAARQGVSVKRVGVGDKGISFTGIGAWIVWGVELLLAALVAGGMAFSRAREPFCESCDAWYRPEQAMASGGGGSSAMRKQLMAALGDGDADAAAAAFFELRGRKAGASFQLTSATCGQCGSDAYCRLYRVVVQRKKTQRNKLEAWQLDKPELARFGDALGRAHARQASQQAS